MTEKPSISFILGCDPQAKVTITETGTGTLFVVVGPADPAVDVLDVDGVFFNLSDDSTLDSLNFFPDANAGSIFAPVTGIQAAVDAVDTLSNGAQVADQYDVGLQFGTVADTTEGVVNQASFTLFSDNGPMTIADLDADSFAVVVDSDGGNGQVLTTGGAGGPDGGDPVLVSKEVLFENFDDIHEPEQSAAIDGPTNWAVAWDKLVTNSYNEGVLALKTVPTDGPVTLSFDANVHDTHLFENSGWGEDSLRVEVNIDGTGWVLLDEFQVNDAGTAIVGSETGQSFGNTPGGITYSGGILDTAESDVQFRFVSDVTASDEWIKIDNLSVTASEEVEGGTNVVCVETSVSDDFDGLYEPEQSELVEGQTNWAAAWGKLVTNSHNEGVLELKAVPTDGAATLTFDANVHDTRLFENSGWGEDSLRVEVSLDGGEWVLLDEFQVNDAGTAIVGSETGQSFGNHPGQVTYEGGILDTAQESVQFRFVSDLTASDEWMKIDNVEITACEETVTGDDLCSDPKVVLSESFDGIHAPTDSDAIASSDQWAVDTWYGDLNTDGCRDGTLQLETIQSEGPTSISFDAMVGCAGNFENSGSMADSLRLEVQLGDGEWTLLDEFRVNDAGTKLVGSETGNTIEGHYTSLEYTGGVLDEAKGDVTFRFVSDISASNEDIYIDNIEVTACEGVPVEEDDCKGQYDVEYLAGIPLLQPIDDDQLKDLDAAGEEVLDELAV
ncbi:hypothetical protein ABMC89_06155 [Sulfitobacter sp. HNIBRBA3233]|uniref:hypothetical protein n=1 Tax=Sulfitobacter marinivivus TaxID=3158558 RepID=UPI0032E044CF